MPDSDATPAPDTGAGTWRTASAELLAALGWGQESIATEAPGDLARELLGTGLELTRGALDNSQVPLVEGALGCVVRTVRGWRAVVGRSSAEPAAAGSEPVLEVWVLQSRPREDFGALLGFLARHRRELGGLFLAAIIVNVLALSLPLFSSFVYDKVLGNGVLDTMWALVIGLLIVVVIDFCVRTLRTVIAERFGVASETEIDHAIFTNLLRVRANKAPPLGAVLENYKQVLSYRDMLSSNLLIALADLPFLGLFLFAIVAVSGPLVFVSLGCGVLMVAVMLLTNAPVMVYEHRSREASEQRYSLLSDIMGSLEGIVGQSARRALEARWRRSSVTAAVAASKARYWRGLAGSFSASLSYLSYIAVLVGGVYLIEAHSLTSGGLLAASMLTSRAMAMIGSAVSLYIRWGEFRIALRKLDETVPAIAPTMDQHYGRLAGNVKVDKLTCRLRPEDQPVLRDLEFAVNAGEIVGIAGSPGSGKTTLLRAMAGLIELESGRVLLDHIPVSSLGGQDVTLNIGYKPQDCSLLDTTILENVLAGGAALGTEDRRRLLAASGLASAFETGALNWMTPVGPRGSRLSGGQRQLVALARALAGSPPLLLLDEPTNGLDAALENHVAQQIAALRGRSTVFVSTHSRSLLQVCDRLLVVGDGKLLANGPRERILA